MKTNEAINLLLNVIIFNSYNRIFYQVSPCSSLITKAEEADSMETETSISRTTTQRYPKECCIINDMGLESLRS